MGVGIRSPFSVIGGKFFMKKEIIPLLDYSRVCYIEPFFGSGQVFFAKKPHRVEIINDIDGDLMNFFRAWKSNKDELIKRVSELPYSRELYNEVLTQWKSGNKGETDLDRAVNYFYIARSSFAGKFGYGWGFGYSRSGATSYTAAVKLLERLFHRISNAQIENRPYDIILSSIKKSFENQVVIYADPPYINKESYYKSSFTIYDHMNLANWLNKLTNCKIILSYYLDDRLYEWYPTDRWTYLTFSRIKSSKGLVKNDASTRPASTELLILNFTPSGSGEPNTEGGD